MTEKTESSWETDQESQQAPAEALVSLKSLAKETDPLLPSKHGEPACPLCCPALATWFDDLRVAFGCKLLILLFSVQHVLKGFVHSFASTADPYLYRSYGVPAPQMQLLMTVATLPWAMKPVIGLVSDVFPWWGYNKAPYFLVTAVLGGSAYFAIGFLPHSSFSADSLVKCMFLTNLQVSTCDLLSEAKYAEKIRENPAQGPNLLTYVWFGMSAGGLVAAALGGTIIERFGPQAPYLISSPLAFMVIIPVAFGCLEERRLTDAEVSAVRRRFFKQKEACALCVFMLIGTGTLTVTGLVYRDPYINGIAAIIVMVFIIASFSLVLNPVIAKFNAFSVIQGALSLSISGATFYFYTDNARQYPEGPHFSPVFYNTVMGIGGALCSLLGIYLYQRYLQTWKYRQLLVITNLGASFLSLLDIMMIKRINVQYGIPDHAFVLGSSALETVVTSWMWMPQVVILSYLCPKGMEATMYALLAGCANLGGAVSSNLGALVLAMLGCAPSGQPHESDQFENLWIASAIATFLPLATILLLFWLVPDVQQNTRIMDEDADACSGSVMRQMCGRTD